MIQHPRLLLAALGGVPADKQFVTGLQQQLRARGLYNKTDAGVELTDDGIAGEYTRKGLQRWAGLSGTDVDGVLGRQSLDAINKKLQENPSDPIAAMLITKLGIRPVEHSKDQPPAAASSTAPPSQASPAPALPTGFSLGPDVVFSPADAGRPRSLPQTGDPVRDAIVSQAFTYLGTQEQRNPATKQENRGPFVAHLATYGEQNFGLQRQWPTQGVPYCTLFPSAILAMVDKGAGSTSLTFPYTASSGAMAGAFQGMQRPGAPRVAHRMTGNPTDRLPQPGDIMINSHGVGMGHSGIIVGSERDAEGRIILNVISSNIDTTSSDPDRRITNRGNDGTVQDTFRIELNGHVTRLTGPEDATRTTMTVVDVSAVPGHSRLAGRIRANGFQPETPPFPTNPGVVAVQRDMVLGWNRDTPSAQVDRTGFRYPKVSVQAGL